jgi:RNA polymerase sigma-70 factor, ECF subfamily
MGFEMENKIRQVTRLWTLSQPMVSAFVTSIVRDFKDRDDVLQDIAVAAFESFDSYDPERPFLPWVMGVARNQVRLYLRQAQRDRLRFHDDTVNHIATAISEVSNLHLHRLDALTDCLKLLEGRAEEICRLRYQNDLKPGVIAKNLGMTPNSVAKALQRIRDQLRECINRKSVEGIAQ